MTTDCCTIAISHGAASADGRIYILKNRDSIPLVSGLELPFVEKAEHDGHGAILSVTLLGDYGCPGGMNEAGLAAVCSYVFPGRIGITGVPPRGMIKKVLKECSSVEEAVALIENTKRRFGSNFLLADATGRAAIVEFKPSAVETIEIRDTAAGRANHFISLKPDLNITTNASLIRYRRIAELLDENDGGICLETMFRFARDRERGNTLDSIDNPATEFSTVIAPDAEFPRSLSVIWAAVGRPAATPFLPVYIGGKAPAEYTDGSAWKRSRKTAASKRAPGPLEALEKAVLKESAEVERRARKLLRDGKKNEGDALLTSFTEKCKNGYLDAIGERTSRAPGHAEIVRDSLAAGLSRIVTGIF
ncbi:C45 family autoproteolytic acyltransferase/hydrolase [bacterium]